MKLSKAQMRVLKDIIESKVPTNNRALQSLSKNGIIDIEKMEIKKHFYNEIYKLVYDNYHFIQPRQIRRYD